MALALNNLRRVDMPLNKETETEKLQNIYFYLHYMEHSINFLKLNMYISYGTFKKKWYTVLDISYHPKNEPFVLLPEIYMKLQWLTYI